MQGKFQRVGEVMKCCMLTRLSSSDLRQVPDNQEVLLGLDDDTTIIVEVLESVKEGKAKDSLEEAIR